MRKSLGCLLVGCLTWLAFAGPARAELKPDRVFLAEGRKTQKYVKDGLVTGGDKAVEEFAATDLRRAMNQGYERIVLDLAGTRGGEPMPIARPPYFQAAVSPDEKRVVVTVFGKPRLKLDTRRILASFKKSPVVESVQFFPVLDDASWTFALELKSGRSVEIFELTNPVRLIMDIRTQADPSAAQPDDE